MPDDIKETPLIAATNEVEQDRALSVARSEASTDNIRATNEQVRAYVKLLEARATLRTGFTVLVLVGTLVLVLGAILAAIRLG